MAVLRPREGGLRRGENFWLCLTTASAQCLCLLLSAFFIIIVIDLTAVWYVCMCVAAGYQYQSLLYGPPAPSHLSAHVPPYPPPPPAPPSAAFSQPLPLNSTTNEGRYQWPPPPSSPASTSHRYACLVCMCGARCPLQLG